MFAGHVGTEIVPTSLSDAGPLVAASVTRDEGKRKPYIKLVNETSEVKNVKIALGEITTVNGPATLVTLSGKSPIATYSIRNLESIKPCRA